LLIAVKEETVALHAATHAQSYKTTDHSFKLISMLLEPMSGLPE